MKAQFDRFDICSAYWLYAYGYHCGQFSHWYSVLGRLHNMGFKPTAMSYRELSENGKLIYTAILHREIEKGKTP